MAETVRMMLDEFTQYDDFVEKFRPKKTTDDCYTPAPVYEAVLRWAVRRYGLEGRQVLRPFFPGGDYERAEYLEGSVVIDNPPFSILAQIERFYLRRGVDFFLFAPGLSIFRQDQRLGYVICDLAIRYENGAEVPTSFVTNLGENRIETAPELSREIRGIQANNKQAPKYEYPHNIITAAKVRYLDGKGIRYAVPKSTPAEFVRHVDANKQKGIFGGGFLVGQKAAAAQAAAQAAVQARVFALSPRELALVEMLDKMEGDEENGTRNGS